MISNSLYTGKNHQDERGILSFWNDFNMINIKRMYTIYHHSTLTIRAWQGHKHEEKWFYVVSGSFKIVLVKPDDWVNPSPVLLPEIHHLESSENCVLHVLGGNASGFKAESENSKMIIFSNLTLEESKLDDFRFDSSLWYNW